MDDLVNNLEYGLDKDSDKEPVNESENESVKYNNTGKDSDNKKELSDHENIIKNSNVNVKAMFFVTQSVLTTMVQQGSGAVIDITSNHAFTAMVEHSVQV